LNNNRTLWINTFFFTSDFLGFDEIGQYLSCDCRINGVDVPPKIFTELTSYDYEKFMHSTVFLPVLSPIQETYSGGIMDFSPIALMV